MVHRPRHVAASVTLLTALGTACAGDIGAEQGPLPTCNARPVDPPGYQSVATEKVESSDHFGHRYAYLGPDGQELEFLFGIASDAGSGLPKKAQLPLASVGTGTLHGDGEQWAFLWNDTFPCDPMSVTGTGFDRKAFVDVLGFTHVTPPVEEEGAGEGGIEGGVEEQEEEGEVEGVIPPGGPAVEFVAVYDTAPSIEELDPSPEELMEVAGENVEASPASCWKGLPQRLGVPRDSYVAAIVAITRNELDFAIEAFGTIPLFSGQLRARCQD
ncbi:MAG: hypothetical protein ACRDH9_08840 [Actinomycetota bacterium]